MPPPLVRPICIHLTIHSILDNICINRKNDNQIHPSTRLTAFPIVKTLIRYIDILKGSPPPLKNTAPLDAPINYKGRRTGRRGVCVGKAGNSRLNFPPIFNISRSFQGGGGDAGQGRIMYKGIHQGAEA